MLTWTTAFLGWMLLINIISFVAVWSDKRKAEKDNWRTPERTLFAFALLGGIIGHIWAMRKFRHKTRKISFLLITFLLVLVNVFWWYLFFTEIAF
jgi:uncharacterized membrane protein YsdA (DUF1294 family)